MNPTLQNARLRSDRSRREASRVPDSGDGRERLEQLLGTSFSSAALLAEALVHDSYPNENPDFEGGTNERLEFLGDAVAGLVVADRLFHRFPDSAEGELTRLRAELVRGETFADVARRLRLGEYLLMGRGEEAAGGRDRTAVLATAFEAVVGALWLDRGLEAVRERLAAWMEPEWRRVEAGEVEVEPKTRLQHVAQGRFKQTPEYRTLASEGSDQARVFTVEVRAGGGIVGVGKGPSKQAAEKAAARDALKLLQEDGG